MSYPSKDALAKELKEKETKKLQQDSFESSYETREELAEELADKPTSPLVIATPRLTGFSKSRQRNIREQLAEKQTQSGIVLLPRQVIQGLVYQQLQRIREELGIDPDEFDPFSTYFEPQPENLEEAPVEELEEAEDEDFFSGFMQGGMITIKGNVGQKIGQKMQGGMIKIYNKEKNHDQMFHHIEEYNSNIFEKFIEDVPMYDEKKYIFKTPFKKSYESNSPEIKTDFYQLSNNLEYILSEISDEENLNIIKKKSIDKY